MLSILLKKAISLPADQGVRVSGGNLITARRELAGGGTTSSALAFGGTVTGSAGINNTEEYNNV